MHCTDYWLVHINSLLPHGVCWVHIAPALESTDKEVQVTNGSVF